MRKGTIENLKTSQPREQNMQLSFDKRCSFPAQNSAFSLCQTRLMSGKLSRLKSKHTRKNRHARLRDALGTPSLRKIVCGEPRVSEDDEIESDIFPCFVWRVIRVKIQCTNFSHFEFQNKSFCVQLLSNCSSFSSLNFETGLFAYNYFLIAALAACVIVNEVYLDITC